MAGTITHQWNGTVLTITSDSGTSSSDLKGAKGDDGPRGAQGAPGSSVAEDSQMLGGVAAAQYALKNNVPAHNLLDNSDFTNPVNQRGATTATLGKYFIDRWNTEPYPSGPSITIDSNGLTLLPTTSSTAGIFQKIPDYEKRKGKTHTFAICVGNEWKCVPFIMGNFGVGYQIHGLYFFSVDSRHILIRNNTSDNPAPITIQRVALYEGSYTASTLPAYQPKGYAAELAECQRYYLPLNNQLLGSGYTFSDGAALLVPRKMRIDAPSFVASGTIRARVNGADYPLTLSSITTYGSMIKVDFASNNIPMNYPCAFYSDASSVSLNADL